MKGKIIVIVAPSGTGKTTMITQLMKEIKTLKWSVSSTTRAPRGGEVDGQDYFFLSHEVFEQKIEDGDFIEYAKVHSNYYGTEKSVVNEALMRGENLLMDIDVQGCDNIKKMFGDDAQVIYIAPPDLKELEDRLRRRGTESEEDILVRMKNAEIDMKRQNDFDYLIINDDYGKAYSTLKTIITTLTEEKR